MWFKLASATFSTHLGSMSSLSSSISIKYTANGFSYTTNSVSKTASSANLELNLMSGWECKSTPTVSVSGAAVVNGTPTWSNNKLTIAIKPASSESTFEAAGSIINVSVSGATATSSGGNTGGESGGNSGGTTTYNNVSYWVRQSISNTGAIETPDTAGYTRSNIMAINKFTKAITLKGTSEEMYFAKVTYDANGNFLARSSWDTPAVGATVTYSDTNPFNVVIATRATTNYDLATMVSIIDVRDA